MNSHPKGTIAVPLGLYVQSVIDSKKWIVLRNHLQADKSDLDET